MKRYQDHLIQALKDPEEAEGYLNAVLETGDPKMFLVALHNVVEARGGMLCLSRKIKMSRSNLYKMLSRNGHPEIQSLHKVLAALGLSLAVSIRNQRGKGPISRLASGKSKK